MKSFHVILLSLVLPFSLVGCKQLPEVPQVSIPTGVETGGMETPFSNEISFHSFQDVINRFQALIADETNTEQLQSNLVFVNDNDRRIESALESAVINSDSRCLGYALFDVNGDSQNELVLMDEHYHVYALFSKAGDIPRLLDSFFANNHVLAIGKDGMLCKSGYGKGENTYTEIMKLSDSGELETVLVYGCSDDGEVQEFYIMENGIKRSATEQEIAVLDERYAALVREPTEATRQSGILFISLSGDTPLPDGK